MNKEKPRQEREEKKRYSERIFFANLCTFT